MDARANTIQMEKELVDEINLSLDTKELN